MAILTSWAGWPQLCLQIVPTRRRDYSGPPGSRALAGRTRGLSDVRSRRGLGLATPRWPVPRHLGAVSSHLQPSGLRPTPPPTCPDGPGWPAGIPWLRMRLRCTNRGCQSPGGRIATAPRSGWQWRTNGHHPGTDKRRGVRRKGPGCLFAGARVPWTDSRVLLDQP